MSTHFNDIEAALASRLNTMTGLPPVAWPNIEYSRTKGTLYLHPVLIPNSTEQASLSDSGKDFAMGIYQIGVMIPAGKGRSTIPDQIADHFKRGTFCVYNGISVRVRSVSVAPALQDGDWYMVPVSISYFAYTEARA